MRMSRGPSLRKLMPRSGSVSWGELTPRSATMPSTVGRAETRRGAPRWPRIARARAARPHRNARGARCGRFDGAPILIDADHGGARRRFEDRLGVPAPAERRVDVDAAASRSERGDHLRPEDGGVSEGRGARRRHEVVRRHVHILNCSVTTRRNSTAPRASSFGLHPIFPATRARPC